MEAFLPELLRMSLTGAVVILAVLLARLPLRRFPRKYVCLLWLAVLFRLLCPVTLHSPTSVMPEKVESGALVSAWTESYAEETRVIRRGEAGYKDALAAGRTPQLGYPPASQEGAAEAPSDPVETEAQPDADQGRLTAQRYVVTAADGVSEPKTVGETWLPVLGWVWLAGAAGLLLWSVFKYLRLRFRLREAVKLEKGVYEAEGLDSPFVLGVFCPRVYLPWGMAEDQRAWVLLHERAHIRRLDPLWKLLGWLALCLHWFNPLCWLAFSLAMQDMEGACDEAVARRLDREERAAYSDLLLSLSAGRPLFAATPLGFGEGNVKQRIRSVLRWRKPKWWMALLAVLLLAAVALLFALGPRRNTGELQQGDGPEAWLRSSCFTERWTEVAAGQRGVWPVKDAKGFKKELTKLLEEGEWNIGGVCPVGEDDSFMRRLLPGKLRWVSGGTQWQLYVGGGSLLLSQDGAFVWYGSAVGEASSPDRLYSVDQERMEAILALTERGEPALTLEPSADLCFAGLSWGCTLEEAMAALPGAARSGLTLTATGVSVCGFRTDAVLTFEEDEGGTFLNTIALTFTEEAEAVELERFDRAVLCEELSRTWGERHNMLPNPQDPSAVLIDDWGNPERLWYWYTEDFSDEYQWMSGVTGWFERRGDPRTLYLDASGRNLAAGRRFSVARNDLTVHQILRLHDLLEHTLPDGCEFSNRSLEIVSLRVTDPDDLAWLKELLSCWPWVEVGRFMLIQDSDDPPPEPSPPPHYPVEEGWTLLTEEEIEAAREALEPVRFREDGSMWVNPADPCFTSFYTDPKELNFSAFLRYFGIGEPTVTAATEEDFRALREAGYLWGSRWIRLEDMEVPLTRIPASTVEAALRRFYDIGLNDLKTDWRSHYRYLPETDCFYSVTSDFGPGTFQPAWGERKDDVVRLWNSQTCLTCRKLEDRWIILSFRNENADSSGWDVDEGWPPLRRDYFCSPEYPWIFTPAETEYRWEDGEDTVTGTIPAGWRLQLLEERHTPEGEIWLEVEQEAVKAPASRQVLVRAEDVIPWTEDLADQTVWPVFIPAGVTYYPANFGDWASDSPEDCIRPENAAAHGYDQEGVILETAGDWAHVGVAGSLEVWILHAELTVGSPKEAQPDERTRMLLAGRDKARELGYPLDTWGAELIWHRGKENTEESAYYAAYYPVTTGEGTVCVVFAGSYGSGWTPERSLLIPPGAEEWP